MNDEHREKKSLRAAATRIETERMIGEYGGTAGGPLLIILGGVHGNEPAAVTALQRVIEDLQRLKPPFAGKLSVLGGNLAALKRTCRYIDEDLNRIWLPERIFPKNGRNGASMPISVESGEQRELLAALRRQMRFPFSEVFLLDLHTTSADSPPFLILADTIRNRRFARQLGAPIVLGLEELLDGTILNFLGEYGVRTLAFEAGRHDAPQSEEYHYSAVWLALVAAGCLRPEQVADMEEHRRRLRRAAAGLPRVFEVRCRHGIQPEEQFRMQPGFANFQKVRKGQLLAHNIHGELRSREDGHIFMPLYQAQGSDGYFLIRKVNRSWLYLSELLRRLKLYRLLPFLPGIRRHPNNPDILLVNPSVARWWVVEIFHLCGYRKRRRVQGMLVFSKRRFDLTAPPREIAAALDRKEIF